MNPPATTASIAVQEERIDSERAVLVDALHRFLTPYLTAEQNDSRFTWLYRTNPHGTPRVWTAREPGGQVIGVATAFPRRLRAGNVEEQGWVLGDFCIHPDHRSLGPAVRLQRVFLEEARAGRLRFWYDFPNPGMVAVYRRMGLTPTHEAIRFAKPLRLDAKLEPIVRSRLLASVLAAPGNWLLGVTGPPPSDRGGFEFETAREPCGEEFTDLFREVHTGLGLATDRSAGYLNWRYRDDPLQRYEFLTARRHGSLMGYAVLQIGDAEAHVVDLVGADGTAVITSLLGAAIRRSRAAALSTLSVPLLSTHAWIPWLRSLGFHPRESSPVVAGGSPDSAGMAHLEAGGRWHLVKGDRDS